MIVIMLLPPKYARGGHTDVDHSNLFDCHIRRDENYLDSLSNTLTLFGLVLAIAIVVDDAIVVVEKLCATYRRADKCLRVRQ